MKPKGMADDIQICLLLVGEQAIGIYVPLLLPEACWNNESMYISGEAAEA